MQVGCGSDRRDFKKALFFSFFRKDTVQHTCVRMLIRGRCLMLVLVGEEEKKAFLTSGDQH